MSSLYNDKGLQKQTCFPPFPKILMWLKPMLRCYNYLMTFEKNWIGHLSTFFSKGFGFVHRMSVGIFCLKKVKTWSKNESPLWEGFYCFWLLKLWSKINKWARFLPRKLKIEIFKIYVPFLRRTSWTRICFPVRNLPTNASGDWGISCISLVRNLLDNQHWLEPKSLWANVIRRWKHY